MYIENDKSMRQKLSSIVDSHYPVTSVHPKAENVFIERTDEAVENISHIRIVLAHIKEDENPSNAPSTTHETHVDRLHKRFNSCDKNIICDINYVEITYQEIISWGVMSHTLIHVCIAWFFNYRNNVSDLTSSNSV